MDQPFPALIVRLLFRRDGNVASLFIDWTFMKISINQQHWDVEEAAVLTDVLAAFNARPPFAVALNGDFVPRARYAVQLLAEGDRVDVVQPVAGG